MGKTEYYSAKEGKGTIRNIIGCFNSIKFFINDSLERTDSCNFVSRVNDGRSSTLRSHENNINEIRCRRHWTHFLEVIDGHDD